MWGDSHFHNSALLALDAADLCGGGGETEGGRAQCGVIHTSTPQPCLPLLLPTSAEEGGSGSLRGAQ